MSCMDNNRRAQRLRPHLLIVLIWIWLLSASGGYLPMP